MLGFAAKAEKALELADSVANAADWWLTAAKADGLAIIAVNACGLANTACNAALLSLFDTADEATNDCAL